MTPAQHSTEAAALLQRVADVNHTTDDAGTRHQLTQRAQAHAALASKSGSGTDYAAADALLTRVADVTDPAGAGDRQQLVERAKAHALLAS